MLVLTLNCKYEDGPWISFTSIPNRIVGAYRLESVIVNGQDVTAQMDSLNIDHFHLDDEKQIIGGDGGFWVIYVDTTTVQYESWSLHYKDKEEIEFGVVSAKFAPLPGFFYTPSSNSWQILKLSNNRFWLKINFNDQEYEVHLKEK